VGSITPGVRLALHQTASTGTRGTPQLFAGPGRLRRASIDGALRFEELLVVPRVLVGIAVALMSVLVPGVWVPGLLGVGGYFVAISAVAAHRLTVIPPDRGPFLWTSAADTAGCFAVLIVLGAAAEPPGVLLFPLLAFELALKYCVRGTAVALGLLTVSIGLRLAYRADHFGAAPRVWLILLLLATTGLLVGVAGVLRASERRRWQAVEDRRRLAQLLRETVEATGAVPPAVAASRRSDRRRRQRCRLRQQPGEATAPCGCHLRARLADWGPGLACVDSGPGSMGQGRRRSRSAVTDHDDALHALVPSTGSKTTPPGAG